MIDISKYKLVLIVNFFKDGYDVNHDDLHLLDVDDLEDGVLTVYKVLHVDSNLKPLTVVDTTDEVKYDLCCLYGLKELDKDMYDNIKKDI